MKDNKEKDVVIQDDSDKPIFAQKKNVVRLVLFIVALVIAVTAITIGVVQIGKKDPGLYEVEADPDGNLPFFDSGIRLMHYFDGSSDSIKEQMNAIKMQYTYALKKTYKWFDSKDTYLDTINLAAINQSAGQPVKIEKTLFDILSDAYEKTEKKEGYSIFAGPLVEFANNIIYSNEPYLIDVINDAENASFVEKLVDKQAS